MDKTAERRKEQRLRYHWPIWYAEDYDQTLSQGQMVDVSSAGAAFTCYTHESCPCPGQRLTARFSVPRFGAGDAFHMATFVRPGHVCRVDDIDRFLRRVAIRFAEPLPFKPGEQAGSEADTQRRLKAITI